MIFKSKQSGVYFEKSIIWSIIFNKCLINWVYNKESDKFARRVIMATYTVSSNGTTTTGTTSNDTITVNGDGNIVNSGGRER
jgi:hypothetical protein